MPAYTTYVRINLWYFPPCLFNAFANVLSSLERPCPHWGPVYVNKFARSLASTNRREQVVGRHGLLQFFNATICESTFVLLKGCFSWTGPLRWKKIMHRRWCFRQYILVSGKPLTGRFFWLDWVVGIDYQLVWNVCVQWKVILKKRTNL